MYEEFNGRVFVPSNLKNNKQTVLGKFDLREILFILVSLSLFIVLFNFLKNIISNSLALLLSLSVSCPLLFSGFIKFDGLKIEEYIIVMRANKILSTTVRINNADNIYDKYERNCLKQLNKDKLDGDTIFLNKSNNKKEERNNFFIDLVFSKKRKENEKSKKKKNKKII